MSFFLSYLAVAAVFTWGLMVLERHEGQRPALALNVIAGLLWPLFFVCAVIAAALALFVLAFHDLKASRSSCASPGRRRSEGAPARRARAPRDQGLPPSLVGSSLSGVKRRVP